MILLSYDADVPIKYLRKLCYTNRLGTTLLNLKKGAETCGFKAKAVKLEFDKDMLFDGPVIAYLPLKNHFIVIFKIKNRHVYIADPANGIIKYRHEDFKFIWQDSKTNKGIALLLSPSDQLKDLSSDEPKESNILIKFITKFVKGHRKYLFQLLISIGSLTIIQALIPFLTQSLIDKGVPGKDFNYIYLILFAQAAVLLGKTFNEISRSWLLLHLSTRLNLSLLYEFFLKLFKLPIAYFDTKVIGDYLQRIDDHHRIQRLITTSTLTLLFSLLTFIVYSIMLGYYSKLVLLIFIGGSVLYFIWISIFFSRRKKIDYDRFDKLSEEREKVLEILNGMQEIKLQNLQSNNLNSWSKIQLQLFKISIKSLKVDQLQTSGSNLLNEMKNIAIIGMAAVLVINGSLTLGMLLAISYIVGVLNTPVAQMLQFIRSFQDANLSIQRIDEIHEEQEEQEFGGEEIQNLSYSKAIIVSNLTFRYPGEPLEVISNLNLSIPVNKTTAIVGASGSGKTTLLKLLLKYYVPDSGSIKIGPYDLKSISHNSFRKLCGVVMQDGFIFNDSIEYNITLSKDLVDFEKLYEASKIACIDEFINELPTGYKTLIGLNGRPLSGGQKQRILIARAVYKKPEVFLFDEATSSLDATNEKSISMNLEDCFDGKTAIIIAHRLSTIKNSDKIIVLNEGKMVEEGSHFELISKNGYYYNLVENQLVS